MSLKEKQILTNLKLLNSSLTTNSYEFVQVSENEVANSYKFVRPHSYKFVQFI